MPQPRHSETSPQTGRGNPSPNTGENGLPQPLAGLHSARGVAGASQRGGSARIPARGPCARNRPSRPEWGPAAKRWACVPFACGAAPYSGKEGRHPFAEEADSQSPSIRVPKPGWVSRKALVPSSMAQPVKLTWELSSTWRKSPPRFSKAHSRKSAAV